MTMQRVENLPTLRELRQRTRLTQAQLAFKASVSETTIANWEQGRSVPMLDQFRRVCAVLGVPMGRVALTPYERLIYTHKVWYHLRAHRDGSNQWKARAVGVDFGELLSKGDRWGTTLAELPKPMDESDPDTTSVVVPVTWNWEVVAATSDKALDQLADRIADRINEALDRAYASVQG